MTNRILLSFRKSIITFITIILMSNIFLSSCGRSFSWNQKITITVQTPFGIKTGSSVVQWSLSETAWGPPEVRGVSDSFRGEAVVVEVAPRKYLFALLVGMPRADSIFFPQLAPIEFESKLNSLKGFELSLTKKQYPILVMFDNPNIPESVRLVEPSHFDKIFGTGYSLISINISITDEPITSGKIEKILNWLGPALHPERFIISNQNHYDFSFAAKLRQDAFIMRGSLR